MDTSRDSHALLTPSEQRLQSAILRFAYARQFNVKIGESPSQPNLELQEALKSKGLADTDIQDVIAADEAVTRHLALTRAEKWSQKLYNDAQWKQIKEEFSQGAGKTINWPPVGGSFLPTWSDALIEAGLTPAAKSRELPERDNVVEIVKKFLAETENKSDAGSYVAWRREGNEKVAPPLSRIERVFGSWQHALKAAGWVPGAMSQSQQEQQNAQDHLVASREGHRERAEGIRERMLVDASPALVAEHDQLIATIAAETHALESALLNNHHLAEREEATKKQDRFINVLLPIYAIAAGVVAAFLGPVVEWLLP